MGVCAADVSAGFGRRVSRVSESRRLARGEFHVDAGLSARGPALFRGHPAAHPAACAVHRTARQSGRRRRRLQLAVALRRSNRPVETHRCPGGPVARVSAARRLLHVRRLLGRGTVAGFHGEHAAGVSGPSGGEHSRERPGAADRLRSARPLSGAGSAISLDGRHVQMRRLSGLLARHL